ncbi:MAG: hypothetical protein Q9194_006601 [Teloschistes cf. exilis]
MDKTYKQLTEFCGKPPRGVVAPWWESSKEGAELMMKYGVEYGLSSLHNLLKKTLHSQSEILPTKSKVSELHADRCMALFSHHDCLPYYLRIGDSWTPINYDKDPSHWMKPLEPGSETGLVEIPASWYLDDLPPMMFIKKAPNSHGWVNPRDVEDLWRDQFDYFYREYDEFCFPVTIHPDVSGHPHVLFMLERLIEYISSKKGVEWVKMEDICDDFKSKNKPAKGALLPAEHGAIIQNPALSRKMQVRISTTPFCPSSAMTERQCRHAGIYSPEAPVPFHKFRQRLFVEASVVHQSSDLALYHVNLGQDSFLRPAFKPRRPASASMDNMGNHHWSNTDLPASSAALDMQTGGVG